MIRQALLFFTGGMLLGGALVWLASGHSALGDQAPTGYTLDDVYRLIVTNGGTSPVEGSHSLSARSAPGEARMHTPREIMAALRERLPASTPLGCILPATGQTKCYDTDGHEIDCASKEWPGQDGFYQAGCPTLGRFTDNGDGTITDSCTGLMWQKDTAPGNYTWQQALEYCESLDLAGHTDWRLPNIRELQSIVDYGRTGPASDPIFAITQPDGWYWSSTSNAKNASFAWKIQFGVGCIYYSESCKFCDQSFAHAVRGGS